MENTEKPIPNQIHKMLWIAMSNYCKEMCVLIIILHIHINMHIQVEYKARHETMPVLEIIFNVS